MFLKAKYTALVLFSALTFRILFLNIPYTASVITEPAKVMALASIEKASTHMPSEYAQYQVKPDISMAELSEEDMEDDSKESFEKGSRLPVFLLTFFYASAKPSDDQGLRSLADLTHTKQSNKTYLSISVLRI